MIAATLPPDDMLSHWDFLTLKRYCSCLKIKLKLTFRERQDYHTVKRGIYGYPFGVFKSARLHWDVRQT